MSESIIKFCVRIRNSQFDINNKRTNIFIHKNVNHKLISLQRPILKADLYNEKVDITNLNEFTPTVMQLDNVFDENE